MNLRKDLTRRELFQTESAVIAALSSSAASAAPDVPPVRRLSGQRQVLRREAA
jgi:hypothetical protein